MIRLLKNLKLTEWLMVLTCISFIVFQVWLDMKMLDYMEKVNTLIKTNGAISEIWKNGGTMLLCALGSLLGAFLVGFFASNLGASYSSRLRSRLFNKVDSFSTGEINKFSTPSLITRSTNDVTQVQMLFTMGLQLLIKAPITAVWAILRISDKGSEWTYSTVVAILVLLSAFLVLLFFVIPKFKKMQALTDDLNRVTRENLTGLAVVRAYNAESYQKNKFEKVNEELTATHLFITRGMAIMWPALSLVTNGLPLAIQWFGAKLVNNTADFNKKLSIFIDISVFAQYAGLIIMSFMMIAFMFILLPRASVSAKRINEVLDTEPSIKEGEVTQGEEGKRGEVVFKNVSFKYPDAVEYVIHDISFSANQGEIVAFIGSTGSGKSTLINLIPRFFDVTSGEILIDGVNIKDYKFEALNNKIGYIPQRAVIFDGTVADNVAFGDNGKVQTEDDVRRAVEIAQGADFVEKMTDGYNSKLARGGTNVSGGQKQRLAIARAICKEPEIYIFDDSFSALDYKTDRALRSALRNQMRSATSFIVAQRIGTIMDADRIIVLDEGRIVGMGTHNELIESCAVYKEIAMSQLSEEELGR